MQGVTTNHQEVRRKRQIVVFLLNTGVRNGELCGLSIEDLRIDSVEQMVHVIGKGMKVRWVPLNRAAIAAVRCHLRDRGNPPRGPLFVTPSGVGAGFCSGRESGSTQRFRRGIGAP